VSTADEASNRSAEAEDLELDEATTEQVRGGAKIEVESYSFGASEAKKSPKSPLKPVIEATNLAGEIQL
jgi:hypothetical protein